MRICSTKWKIDGRKRHFYEDLSREWTTHHTSELIIGMGDLSRHVVKNIDGFQAIHGGFSIGERNQKGRMLLLFCNARHLCVTNTWLRKADKKKIWLRM